MSVVARACTVGLAFGLALVGLAPPAAATPVCTDGFHGGPPLAECGSHLVVPRVVVFLRLLDATIHGAIARVDCD